MHRALATACAVIALVGCTGSDESSEVTSFDHDEEDIERMRAQHAQIEEDRGRVVAEQLDADGNAIASSRWRSDFEAAVLEVRADGCRPQGVIGSASLVGDGHAVTAAHVVAGADSVEVIDVAGERHRVDVVLFDHELDIAVLRTPAGIAEPLGFYDGDIDAGMLGQVSLTRHEDDIVVVQTTTVEILRHVDIDTTDIYRDRDVTRAGFEIQATVDPGDSGAVVTIGGAAAGIIWARSIESSNRAWAVDIPEAIRDTSSRRALVDAVDTGRCAN